MKCERDIYRRSLGRLSSKFPSFFIREIDYTLGVCILSFSWAPWFVNVWGIGLCSQPCIDLFLILERLLCDWLELILRILVETSNDLSSPRLSTGFSIGLSEHVFCFDSWNVPTVPWDPRWCVFLLLITWYYCAANLIDKLRSVASIPWQWLCTLLLCELRCRIHFYLWNYYTFLKL